MKVTEKKSEKLKKNYEVSVGADKIERRLEEKLKEVIVSELKRQAANSPRSLQVDASKELVVKGRVNIEELVTAIAGSIGGGR